MWIVAWTLQTLEDHYAVVETKGEALDKYNDLLHRGDLYCACIAPISLGTEPHWMVKHE